MVDERAAASEDVRYVNLSSSRCRSWAAAVAYLVAYESAVLAIREKVHARATCRDTAVLRADCPRCTSVLVYARG